MSGKRKDYISWDEYFMGVAVLSGMRSKDPNTQVGACIVSEDHKILSMGYNGFPTGCSDDEFPWEREGEPLENKYFYTTHSELNAILNYRGGSLEGATIYVTLFPCNECAKAIIQSGIKEVIYDCDKYADTPSVMASKRMMDAAGVRYHQYHRLPLRRASYCNLQPERRYCHHDKGRKPRGSGTGCSDDRAGRTDSQVFCPADSCSLLRTGRRYRIRICHDRHDRH